MCRLARSDRRPPGLLGPLPHYSDRTMGKALLVLVLGSGLILTKQLFNVTEQERETSKDQVSYQEEVIAREIAQSAFNVGMGVVRSHGEKLPQGVVDLNGASNTGRIGVHTEGRFGGGEYEVRADLTSGHSVRVTATGTYRGAEYVMHDEYRIPVLTAHEDGMVLVEVTETTAGDCSGIFYQAYTLDLSEGEVPDPVMLFPPDKNGRPTTQPIYVEAGTQMNFFIAVDQNCSERPPTTTPQCEVRADAQDYVFDASDFDHVHNALDVKAGALDQTRESIWSFVEQHPNDRQRWRIAWEDIHNEGWDNKTSKDPLSSLQALKTRGYEGLGWPLSDAWQYRQLTNYSNRPDFSDQVIEVRVVSTTDPEYLALQEAERAAQAACGEVVDPPVVEPPVTDPTTVTPPPTTVPDDDLTEFACSCTQNGTNTKTPILHRPPGNESNEQLLCLPQPAIVNAHMRNHNDVLATCDVRRKIRGINRDGE